MLAWGSLNNVVLKRSLRRVGFVPLRVNQTLALSLLALALLASLTSSVFNLYEKFWWLDEALHTYFTFSLTLVLALYGYGKVLTGRHQHRILLVLTIAGLGLACGSLWEIAEWGYDQTVSSEAIYGTTNPITDMSDSMTDLIMNLAGSSAAGITSLRMLITNVDAGGALNRGSEFDALLLTLRGPELPVKLVFTGTGR